jgi:hypothetical protein
MTGLSEDNFLEKLVPHLHRDLNLREDCCPDSNSLVAFCEGTLDASSTERIGHHVSRCGECAEIHQQLLHFESDLQVSKSEWQNAEKRLGNWLDSLLQEDTAPAQQIHKAERWKIFWRLAAVPKVRHAMAGVVFTLVWVASVTLVTLRISHQSFSPWAPKMGTSGQNTVPGVSQTPQAPAADHPALTFRPDYHLANGQDSALVMETLLPGIPSFLTNVVAVTLSRFRIETGTHARIMVASMEHEQDGRFSFQGLLIKPLQQRDTEVPAGVTITGHGLSPSKELTLETLRLPDAVQPTAQSAATQYALRGSNANVEYALQGSGANVIISSQPHRTFSVGEKVEFTFVRDSTYQMLPSPYPHSALRP